MKKEDKELLLKDLSARLSYGVICHTPKGDGHLCSINQTIFGTEYGINVKAIEREYFNDKEVCIKPYLRTISSMTEEEKVEFCDLQDKFLLSSQYPVTCGYDLFDWLDKNMFDYRGLIPQNLAIEITEENNPYKD